MWTGSSSSRLRMVATTGLNRSTNPHISGTRRRSAQATSARVVSRSGVTGFSTRIGLPSSSSARAALSWNAVGVAITAASQSVAASRSSAKAQPSRSASGRTRSGSVSMMTASSAPSDSAITRAWFAPIAPAPTSAIRARAPMGAVSARRTSQIGDLQPCCDSAALSQQWDQQRGHCEGGGDCPGEQSELDAEEERRAGRGHDEEDHRAEGPAHGDPPVAGKRDQDVPKDLREDEADATGGQQREVEVAQLESVAEEDAGHRRSEQGEPDDCNSTEPGHEEQQARQERLELTVPAAGGECGELGQERRLHRLEEKDRYVGDDAAQLEPSSGRLLCRRGEELDCDGADTEQQLGEDRRDQQEAERMSDLAPWRGRAGTEQSAPSDRGERDGDERGHDQRDPVRTRGLDSDHGEDRGERDSQR